MDCFNYSCPFRENTSSSCNRCECVACQNRSEAVTYIASNRTLTETDIRALEATKMPDEYISREAAERAMEGRKDG
nr:MAG TPA: hypothetical protein [Caudoviricetes sp.]